MTGSAWRNAPDCRRSRVSRTICTACVLVSVKSLPSIAKTTFLGCTMSTFRHRLSCTVSNISSLALELFEEVAGSFNHIWPVHHSGHSEGMHSKYAQNQNGRLNTWSFCGHIHTQESALRRVPACQTADHGCGAPLSCRRRSLHIWRTGEAASCLSSAGNLLQLTTAAVRWRTGDGASPAAIRVPQPTVLADWPLEGVL